MSAVDDQDPRARALAALEVYDLGSREQRAERMVWLASHVVTVGAIWERTESSFVMAEARTCFINGEFIGSLFLAMAYVEHTVADALGPPPDGKRSPMLSTAIELARERGLFTESLLDRAKALSELRNPYAHRRPDHDSDILGNRIRSRKAHPHVILEEDAKEALQIMYGFFGHSLRGTF